METVHVILVVSGPAHRVQRQQFSGRGRSSFPFSSICSFPRKNVQKVGGYHTKKLRRSQLLPNPTLEVPITLADARGHDALASAQVMGTSNSGGGSNCLPPCRDGYLRTAEKSIHGFYLPLYGSGFIFDSVLEIWGVDE